MLRLLSFFIFFFFNDTATTEIYTLSLHDALPIYRSAVHITLCDPAPSAPLRGGNSLPPRPPNRSRSTLPTVMARAPAPVSVHGLALALLRKLAERGARVGFLHGLRFAVRGPPGGPELLILHGLGDSIAGWARVLGPLSR